MVVAAVSVTAGAYVLRQQLPADEARLFELLQRSEWRGDTYDVTYGNINAQVTVKNGNYAARVFVAGAEVDVVVKDSTVYFKPGSFEALYTAIGGAAAYQKLSPSLKTELKTFEKRWIHVDLAMAKSQSPAIAKMHCGLALYEQLAAKNTGDWRELRDLYKQQQFIAVNNIEESGSVSVFSLRVDPEQFAVFAGAYEKSPQYAALKRCNNVSFGDTKVPSDALMKVTFDTTVNVVKEFELQMSRDDKSDRIQVRPGTGDTPSLTVPTTTVPYSEFVNGISTAVSSR